VAEPSQVTSANGQTRSQLIQTSASITGIDNIDRSVLLKASDGSEAVAADIRPASNRQPHSDSALSL
jgi:hypothetical protein